MKDLNMRGREVKKETTSTNDRVEVETLDSLASEAEKVLDLTRHAVSTLTNAVVGTRFEEEKLTGDTSKSPETLVDRQFTILRSVIEGLHNIRYDAEFMRQRLGL